MKLAICISLMVVLIILGMMIVQYQRSIDYQLGGIRRDAQQARVLTEDIKERIVNDATYSVLIENNTNDTLFFSLSYKHPNDTMRIRLYPYECYKRLSY